MSEEERRTEPISIRLSKDLRVQLEKSRHTSEGASRSLAHEVEMRLRQSFDLDGQIKKRFGSKYTYATLRSVAEAIDFIEKTCLGSPPRKAWLDDPFTFDLVKAAIGKLFNSLKPRGKRTVPKRFTWDPNEFADFAVGHAILPALIEWNSENTEGLDRQAAVGISVGAHLKQRIGRAGPSPLTVDEKLFDKLLRRYIQSTPKERKLARDAARAMEEKRK